MPAAGGLYFTNATGTYCMKFTTPEGYGAHLAPRLANDTTQQCAQW
jgi:hypothetical protein